MRRSASNPLLSIEDQDTQRYLRSTIDTLVAARGRLMEDDNYDLQVASSMWAMINRFINEARGLAEAGWSRPGTEGWYTRLIALQRREGTKVPGLEPAPKSHSQNRGTGGR